MANASIKTLSTKMNVPKDVIIWHVEKGIKEQTLVLGEDVTRIGRGYGLTPAALIWLVCELNFKDFRAAADILQDMVEPVTTDELYTIRDMAVKQQALVDKLLGLTVEEPEREDLAQEALSTDEQKQFWNECMAVISDLKKETGHSRRQILKTTCEVVTRKYGIVWDELFKEACDTYGLSDGWAIKGLSKLQVVSLSDDNVRSIFKSVLLNYSRYANSAA